MKKFITITGPSSVYVPFSKIEKKYKTHEKVIKIHLQKVVKKKEIVDLETLSNAIGEAIDLVLATAQKNNQEGCYRSWEINFISINMVKIFQSYMNVCRKTLIRGGSNNHYVLYEQFLSIHLMKLKNIGKLLRQNKELKKSLGYMASILCHLFVDLGAIYTFLKKFELAFYTYGCIDDWLKDVKPVGGEIDLPDYRTPLKPHEQEARVNLSCSKYFGLYKLFEAQKYSLPAQCYYLKLAANNSDILFVSPILDTLHDCAMSFYKQGKYIQAALLFNHWIYYWEEANKAALTTEAIEKYDQAIEQFQFNILPRLNQFIFNENKYAFLELDLKNMSAVFSPINFSCYIILKEGCHLKDSYLSKRLKDFNYFIETDNSLIVYDCHRYDTEQFKALLLVLEKYAEKNLNKSDADLGEDMQKLSCQERSSTSCTTILSDSIHPIQKGNSRQKTRSTLTAHQLGFCNPPKDEEVYALGGRNVPKGVFYAYGISLGADTSKVTSADLQEYQSLLKKGEIVPKGQKGVRMVHGKEKIDLVTFKLTDPQKDFQIVLEPSEVTKDNEGNSKHLYRAGSVVFRKK